MLDLLEGEEATGSIMEHKQHQTPSGAVHYWVDRAAGADAPWLVLLPGLTADHSTFEPQFSFFSGRANLLSWDAPAHGLSRPYEIDCLALLLCGEKDSLGDVKPFNRKWTEGDGIPLVWVPGAGHISDADNPDFVNAQIEGFIGLV